MGRVPLRCTNPYQNGSAAPPGSTMTDAGADLTGETVELLQHLIRNRCVNDGTAGERGGAAQQRPPRGLPRGRRPRRRAVRAAPGRRSLVARIEGSDPDAPSVCLMGHTDVVPVSPDGWHGTPSAASSSTARCGAGAPSTCSTSPRRGGGVPPPRPQRLPAAGRPDLLRRGRRGGGRRLGARVDDRAPLGRRRRRLRAHRDGRLAPRRRPQGRHLDRGRRGSPGAGSS